MAFRTISCPEPVSESFSPRWLLEGHLTYSEILARHGYTLGMCGKWHMGQDDRAQAGFSEWATVPGGGGPYRDQEFVHNGVKRRIPGFKTDVMCDFAIDFLDRQKKGGPFYLSCHFHAHALRLPAGARPAMVPRFEILLLSGSAAKSEREPRAASHVFGKREPKLGYSALISGADANMGPGVGEARRTWPSRKIRLWSLRRTRDWSAGHHSVWGKGNGTIPFNMYEAIQVPLIWNHRAEDRDRERLGASDGWRHHRTIIFRRISTNLLSASRRRLTSGECEPATTHLDLQRPMFPNWTNRLYFEYAHARAIRTETLKYIERMAVQRVYDTGMGEGRAWAFGPIARGAA